MAARAAASTPSPRSPRSSSRASTPRPTPCSPADSALRGRVAIANAHRAYGRYRERFADERWRALRAAGARPQRPLWASTGTKDPAYSDVLYVEELIAPGRRQHDARGHPARLRRPRRGRARRSATSTADGRGDPAPTPQDAGIDLAAITAQLEREGVQSFCASYHELLDRIETKTKAASWRPSIPTPSDDDFRGVTANPDRRPPRADNPTSKEPHNGHHDTSKPFQARRIREWGRRRSRARGLARPPLSGLLPPATGVHRRADRLRPGQVLQRPGRLAHLPGALDQRHRARQRPGLHVLRRRHRDPRRASSSRSSPATAPTSSPAGWPASSSTCSPTPASTTSPCATSGSCSPRSPSPASRPSTTPRCGSAATERPLRANR